MNSWYSKTPKPVFLEYLFTPTTINYEPGTQQGKQHQKIDLQNVNFSNILDIFHPF